VSKCDLRDEEKFALFLKKPVWENHSKPGNQLNVHWKVVGLSLNGGFAWYVHFVKKKYVLIWLSSHSGP